jgi:SIR2-like domain
MGDPKVTFLLGAGASMPAGIPGTAAITQRVLDGAGVWRHSDQHFYVGSAPRSAPVPSPTASDPDRAREFAQALADVAQAFFTLAGINRPVNYEDISYQARQIADCLIGEYENPALLPQIELLAAKFTSGDLGLLRHLADMTADYIADIVCGLLGTLGSSPACLGMVVEACADTAIAPVDVATLNHDTLLEAGLRQAGVAYADGFERRYGDVMLWTDSYANQRPRLFKLHGSLDWIRLAIDEGAGHYQVEARALKPDHNHLRDPDGNWLDVPLNDGRPLLLVGTFNKLYDYSGGVFGDQHARFRARLKETTRLVVAGYGFGDKGINRAVIDWLMSPGDKRLVVVHPDPPALVGGARPAIRGKWADLTKSGRLVEIAAGIEHVDWAQVKATF